jgi:hypothetical protein
MIDKHVDLVDRRLLQGQVIPTAEKLYSLFEPHTDGSPGLPPVELATVIGGDR